MQVKKETLVDPSELEPFQNHSNQMAALDYYVSIESDIFVPSYKGHMAELVEGHSCKWTSSSKIRMFFGNCEQQTSQPLRDLH